MYLLLLAVAWAVVLLPPLIQRLVANRPSSTGRDPLAALARRQQSTSLRVVAADAAPTQPEPYAPISADAAQQRRRLVAVGLAIVAMVTLFLVPVVGSPMLVVHLAVDAAIVGFGYLWWQRNQALDQATASVVALSSLRHAANARPPASTTTGELRRVVNG